jgi:hypothetical protein
MNAIDNKNLSIRPSIIILYSFPKSMVKIFRRKGNCNSAIPISKLTPAAFEGSINLVKYIAEKSYGCKTVVIK